MVVILLAMCGIGGMCVAAGEVLALIQRRDHMTPLALLQAGKDLAGHPERYVRDGWHPVVRKLYLTGTSLFLTGAGLLLLLVVLAILANAYR